MFRKLKNKQREAKAYLKRGEIQQQKREYVQALAAFVVVTNICETIPKEKELMATALAHIGQVYALLGKEKRATEYLTSALRTYQKNDDNPGMGQIYYDLAMIYFRQKNTQKAIDKALAGFRAATKASEQIVSCKGLQLLCKWHAQNKEFAKAYHYQQQYIAVKKNICNDGVTCIQIYQSYRLDWKKNSGTEKRMRRLILPGWLKKMRETSCFLWLAFLY